MITGLTWEPVSAGHHTWTLDSSSKLVIVQLMRAGRILAAQGRPTARTSDSHFGRLAAPIVILNRGDFRHR
jgi:hypothetical protein